MEGPDSMASCLAGKQASAAHIATEPLGQRSSCHERVLRTSVEEYRRGR